MLDLQSVVLSMLKIPSRGFIIRGFSRRGLLYMVIVPSCQWEIVVPVDKLNRFFKSEHLSSPGKDEMPLVK